MSAEEFIAWRAYDAISPIDGGREIRQLALMACITANANRDPKRDPFSIDDFDLYKERRPLTRAEEEARFRDAWMSAGLLVVKN